MYCVVVVVVTGNLADASSRHIRRAMEKENSDARKVARREYNEQVRNLARFARKRDKRVMAYEQEEHKIEQEKLAQAKVAAAAQAQALKSSRAKFATEEFRRMDEQAKIRKEVSRHENKRNKENAHTRGTTRSNLR